ncbi:MAG: THUMP domain-containing class I SAM-dependent RNA methyltransferase [Deltaproteobacteria bacterium]
MSEVSPAALQGSTFPIFLVSVPGLEGPLCAEARAHGFKAKTVEGGVELTGGWPDVWRANLELRGPSRILARVDRFRVVHLAKLDARARQVPWAKVLRPDVPVRVEASCRSSRIYHSGAAAERIARAITGELGAQVSDEAEVVIKARIENDLCTIAVDTSGEPLHKRGFKEEVSKAPMRETMAALFLRQCGFSGQEPVLDPMCGSGTFVIEAAEIAAGLKPGRARRFAFEKLATFDAAAWDVLRTAAPASPPPALCFGRDRDAGAIRMSRANAARAGVSQFTAFEVASIEDLERPEGPPGLVIVNPPYGDRIGGAGKLRPLYRSLGHRLLTRFSGWRAGLVTSDPGLAEATGLPFSLTAEPVLHGGLRIALYRTGPLP